ncbi:anti-sigma factor family protein [Streptomyces orinoci]|uniref:Zf-HC2 domain-containing protein n=1 Tax=Streptomyces orinoci TaxID=67339 RepID=A0ABV3K5X8_STRON|nr:zf-HC2 domain-containing protein [Streptomyces orinoci]
MNGSAHHMDVGAYALGVLDPAEAARFEEHLAECDRCAGELEQLLVVTPLLAELKETGPPPRPRPEALDGLLRRVTVARSVQRTRRSVLVAAAAALIVAGPLTTLALTGQEHHPESAAEEMYEQGTKHHAVDPATKADATVSLASKPWGTRVALKLGHVKGPLTCRLVAVSRKGQEQTVTTWAVPASGYGTDKGDKWGAGPLYTHGGTAFPVNDIARFEIRTLDGGHLATVNI